MKNKINKIKYLSLPFLFSPMTALAYNFKEDSGLSDSAGKAGYSESFLSLNPENVIIQGITIVLSFVGVLFLILMIVGGLKWMTALGNDAEVAKAKKIITQGIIGVLIVFAAYTISYFIVQFFGSKTLA